MPIPPDDPSLPDPNLPSPDKAFADRTHPTGAGYGVWAEEYYDGFYKAALNGEGFQINAGLNDAWYNPLTNGQGFFITIFRPLEKVEQYPLSVWSLTILRCVKHLLNEHICRVSATTKIEISSLFN